jgi:MFS family permease
MDNEKKILLFPVASHFLFHFYEIAFPALAIPLTLSLGMELRDVLALGFPMYLLFGLGALPWGVFADRTSNRLALVIGFFGCAAGSLLTALSTTPPGIMGSLALIGAFSCICHPAGMGLISHGARTGGPPWGSSAWPGPRASSRAPFSRVS